MRLCLALLLSVTPLFAQNRAALSPEAIYSKTKPSVVTILTFDGNRAPLGQGSGFIVGPNQIATNYHVVADSTTASVVFNDGSLSSVTAVIAGSLPKDLVILEVETGNRPSLMMGDELKLKVGQTVYAIGAPKGLSASLSNGLVSGFREDEGQFQIQITAQIAPGSSGGPLLNSLGEVVGVTTSRLKDSGFGFAMGVGDLQHLLRAPLSVKIQLSELPGERISTGDLTSIQGLVDQKKYNDARASFDILPSATKASFDAQLLLCRIEQGRKEHRIALQACDAAIQSNPHNVAAYELSTYSFLALGNVDDAEAAASKALELSNDNRYKALLGVVHYSQEKYNLVQEEISPDSNDIFLLTVLAGAAFHNKDFNSFRNIRDKLASLKGETNGWILYLGALNAEKALDWATALDKLKKCDADEDFIDPICKISSTHVELIQGNYSAAKTDIDSVLAIFPKNRSAVSQGIFIDLIVNNTVDADRLHEVFKSTKAGENDEFTECLYYYGRNQPLLATSHCQAAIKGNEKNYQVWSNAGYAALDSADFQSAMSYFSKALQLFYNSTDKHTVIQQLDVSWGTLVAEYFSGDKKNARTMYRAIKKQYPEFSTVPALKQLPLVWSQETTRLINKAASDLK